MTELLAARSTFRAMLYFYYIILAMFTVHRLLSLLLQLNLLLMYALYNYILA